MDHVWGWAWWKHARLGESSFNDSIRHMHAFIGSSCVRIWQMGKGKKKTMRNRKTVERKLTKHMHVIQRSFVLMFYGDCVFLLAEYAVYTFMNAILKFCFAANIASYCEVIGLANKATFPYKWTRETINYPQTETILVLRIQI